ncbi:GH25 family lysozyme [Sphingomonas sp. PB4P5]|uniref:GH25 family lysozyme n=1 Tax=Parasphingomonas puruogangriensis TaxID=3096155 RepID=UPI002FC9F6B2
MAVRLAGVRIGRAGAMAIVLAVIAITLWVVARGWHPSDRTYAFQGIDIGAEQGPVHWPTVAAGGVDFAYLRATIGATGRDPQFATSWADADTAGMRRGAVHVWSFCSPAADQANNFNTNVPRADDALPAALLIDFAEDCATRPERDVVVEGVTRFVTMVEAHTGKPMLLKISGPVEQAYQLSAAIERPLWTIQNFLPPTYAARPWRMWQASDMRRIDGLNGPIHWNVVAP